MTIEEEFRDKTSLLLHERLGLFIDGGEAKSSPVQISYPRKAGSHPENSGQPKRYDINYRFPSISVIIASGSEGTPVTNFKKPAQPTSQLSAINAISTSNQKICINDPDLPLPTSIKSSLRHREILDQPRPPASLSQTSTSIRAWSIYSGRNLILTR